jgi:hypothetical protein
MVLLPPALISVPAIFLLSPPDPSPVLLAAASGIGAFLLSRWNRIGLVGIVVLLFGVLSPPLYPRNTNAPHLIIFGIDALDHEVVTDLLSTGKMPNVRRLIDGGAAGRFETEEPTFSPILWTTIATGRGPDAHGVDGFYHTSDHVSTRRIWDILSEAGWRIGIFRWLVTWPPGEGIDGFWIPDIFARDGRAVPEEYGFLNTFRNRIKGGMIDGGSGLSIRESGNYARTYLRLGVRGSTLLRLLGGALRDRSWIDDGTNRRYLFMRRVELEVNADLFRELLRRYEPDFAAFYDNSVDMVGHRYWSAPEPGQAEPSPLDPHAHGPAIPAVYGWTDAVIGRIAEEIPPTCRIVLVSDHGQRGIGEETRDSWIVRGDNVLRALGLEDRAYVTVLGSFSYLFPVEGGGVYRVGEVVRRELGRIRLVKTDRPLLDVRDDETTGIPFLDFAGTDLSGDEKVSLDGNPVDLDRFAAPYFTQTGEHDADGVIVLSGPEIRPGTVLRDASLRDLVPTLLHWVGEPVARDMDGDVLLAAFDSRREIVVIDSYETNEIPPRPVGVRVDPDVKEKLRALGYVE